MTALLETRALSVTLGKRTVLHGVDVTVRAGEMVGILGPNGAGKSTFLKAALGLVPPLSGSAFLAGRPVTSLSPRERAALAAYLPQDREVAWALTVEAVVALGRLPHRSPFAAPGTADQRAIDRAISDAGIPHLRHRLVTELSGGERTRVLIARALAQETPLLLADEPASGLDPAHQLALLALLRNKAAAGGAIVLSIHELHLAAGWCDRLILLHEGRIAGEGPPSSVLTRQNMLAVYGCDAHITETPQGPVIIPLPANLEETAPHA